MIRGGVRHGPARDSETRHNEITEAFAAFPAAVAGIGLTDEE
jgi:hypothetical protein